MVYLQLLVATLIIGVAAQTEALSEAPSQLLHADDGDQTQITTDGTVLVPTPLRAMDALLAGAVRELNPNNGARLLKEEASAGDDPSAASVQSPAAETSPAPAASPAPDATLLPPTNSSTDATNATSPSSSSMPPPVAPIAPVAPSAPPPPPIVYPPATVSPVLYFTTQLPAVSSAQEFDTTLRAQYMATVSDFVRGASPTPTVAINIMGTYPGNPGVVLPTQVNLLVNDTSTLTFLAGTLQRQPSQVLPTAIFVNASVTNVVLLTPAPPPPQIRYEWVAGQFGECTLLCGGGTQARAVSCYDSLGRPAAPTLCPSARPATSRPCQTQTCLQSAPSNFSLVFGPWGDCSSPCAPANRSRQVTCQSPQGYLAALDLCGTALEALYNSTIQACGTTSACSANHWVYTPWVCNNTAGCGGGVATRNATCISAATQEPVSRFRCRIRELEPLTEPCAMAPCDLPYWRIGQTSDCAPASAADPCGPYVARRAVQCASSLTGEVLNATRCAAQPRPDVAEMLCSALVPPASCQPAPPPQLAAANITVACPDGAALDANGTCCAGQLVDRDGRCCNNATVDACGVCNGTAAVVDALNKCCSGSLDALGLCCSTQVDECGVCNGTSACSLQGQLLLSLPTVSRQGPQDQGAALAAVGSAVADALDSDSRYVAVAAANSSGSGSGRRRRRRRRRSMLAVWGRSWGAWLQEQLWQWWGGAAPREQWYQPLLQQLPLALQHFSTSQQAALQLQHEELKLAIRSAVSRPQQQGRQLRQDQPQDLAASSPGVLLVSFELQYNPHKPLPSSAAAIGQLEEMMVGMVVATADGETGTITGLVNVTRAGLCGDGVCQVAERPAPNKNGSCPQDCAFPFLTCPPYNSREPSCSGRGMCYTSSGVCQCFAGYAGADCSACSDGHIRLGGSCVQLAALANRTACSAPTCAVVQPPAPPPVQVQVGPSRDLTGQLVVVVPVLLGAAALVALSALALAKFKQSRRFRQHLVRLEALQDEDVD